MYLDKQTADENERFLCNFMFNNGWIYSHGIEYRTTEDFKIEKIEPR